MGDGYVHTAGLTSYLDFSPRTRSPIKPDPVLSLMPLTMLLLSLILSLIVLGSSWGEWVGLDQPRLPAVAQASYPGAKGGSQAG